MIDRSPTPGLVRFLASSDERCPACDFSLRDLASSRCPECGAHLEVSLTTTRYPRSAAFWQGLIPLGLAAVLPFLGLVAMPFIADWGGGWRGIDIGWRDVVKYGVSTVLSGLVALIWWRCFPLLGRLSAAWRSLLVLTCVLYAAVALTVTNMLHL